MKKLFLFLLFGTAFALPTPNPYDPTYMRHSKSKLMLFQGFYGDYVFNRNLETDDNQSIQKTTINTNAAYLSVKGWKRFEIFGIFGATGYSITTPSNAFGVMSRTIEVNIADAAGYGFGINSYLFDYGGFGFGLSGHYFTSNNKIFSINNLGPGSPVYFTGPSVHYEEIQSGLSITRKVLLSRSVLLMPYASAKYSQVSMNFDHLSATLQSGETMILQNLEAAHNYGYTVGLTFLGYERANLTFEGRFYDEKALHLNFAFSF